MIPTPTWQYEGACYGKDTSIWYADSSHTGHAPENLAGLTDDTIAAKLICSTCPVLNECIEAGWNERWGVWGGLTFEERRKFVKHTEHRHDLALEFFRRQTRALFGRKEKVA